MDEQVKRRGFLGNETILFDMIVVDTCQHIFVKTHRMYNTKNGPLCKLWTLVNNNGSILADQL